MGERIVTRLNRYGIRLTMLFDVLVLNAVMYGTNLVRFGLDWPNDLGLFVVSYSLATIISFATFYFGGLYEREARLGQQPYLPRVARLMLISGGGIALVTLSSSGFFREFTLSQESGLPFPFLNLFILITLGSLLLTLVRIVARRIHKSRFPRPTVVLVGEPGDVASVTEQLALGDQDFDVLGSVTKPAGLGAALTKKSPTDVLLVSPQWLEKTGEELIYQLDEQGINVFLRVRGIDTMLGLRSISQVSGLPFLQLRTSALPLSQAHFKRLLDLGLVIGLMPLWLPIFLLISLYQLIVAGSPIFFVQQRVGLGGREFPMIKFRTMVKEAEASTGPVLSSSDDHRVIRACKWIRATRMDELPQLLNVLAGHMSVVGPRPERAELIATFGDGIQGYRLRHSVRPGLTGLAQIYGRYNTKPEYKLGYDLHYAVNWSALLDAEILLRTILVVVMRRV